MESNEKVKEADIKSLACFYFDDILEILILIIFY